MMTALAQPDAYPLLLLSGRIAYRKAWALNSQEPPRRYRDKDQNWALEYDELYNFATMGTRIIEDEDWGKPKKQKQKAKPLSPEAMRLLELARGKKTAALR